MKDIISFSVRVFDIYSRPIPDAIIEQFPLDVQDGDSFYLRNKHFRCRTFVSGSHKSISWYLQSTAPTEDDIRLRIFFNDGWL